MAARPYYILFAGVNGAGKSTLYRTNRWQHGMIDGVLSRVNPDEIITANGWDWRDRSVQIKAGRLALGRIRRHLERGESFSQETTLSGKAVMHTVRTAHDDGYHVVMFYVCVDDPAIANARIAHRGAVGGHVVDPSVVARRYNASLSNLVDIIEVCDEVYLYDNTLSLELEVRFESGRLAYFNPLEPHLRWVARVMGALGYVEAF